MRVCVRFNVLCINFYICVPIVIYFETMHIIIAYREKIKKIIKHHTVHTLHTFDKIVDILSVYIIIK